MSGESLHMAGSQNFYMKACLFLALAMAVVVGTALGFEHIGGFIPCKLCLAQREPYYVGIPVMLIGALAAWQRWPVCVSRGALLVGGLLMTYGLVLGVYHSGVEWHWWAGPTDCGAPTGNIATNAGDLLGALSNSHAPTCDQAAGRFLGLSFAGWNVLASLALALDAFRSFMQRADG